MSSRQEIELHNNYDILKGSINRMFITNDFNEFETEYNNAKQILDIIYNGLREIKRR